VTGYREYQHLDVAVDDGTAVVTFASKNEGVLYTSFFTNLRDVFSTLSMDPGVSSVVLTGTGEKFFDGVGTERTARLAGAGFDALADQLLSLQQVVSQILSFRKPTVAAINGDASNIGAQIAFLCDAAVAVTGARFEDKHVRNGVAAGDGGTMLWPLLVGLPRAKEILLHGSVLTAEEALQLHLVSKLVQPPDVLNAGIALARELAVLPRLPYIATKLALSNYWRLSMLTSWDMALGFEAGGLVQPGRGAAH
jgi:enoyl-CoA hydratase/carnithine racemase